MSNKVRELKPVEDAGGQYNMVVNIIAKYSVVPATKSSSKLN